MRLQWVVLGVLVVGCGGSAVGDGVVEPGDVPEAYTFADVDTADQVLRHVLINDLTAHVGALTERIDGGSFAPRAGDLVAELDFFFSFNGATGPDLRHQVATRPAVRQETYGDLGEGVDLKSKLAGNDSDREHKDWSQHFVGWPDVAVTTPQSLVSHWFDRIETLAIARAGGDVVKDPDNQPVGKAFVTAEGQDLQQLLQKFLLGAVAYAQASDDALDEGIEAGDALQAWDEAFGYFGAARDYSLYSDDELAGKGGRPDWQGYHDSNGDGEIDLTTEFNFGHSLNAAKRDRDADTDLTGDAFSAFVQGRFALEHGDRAGAVRARDTAVLAWEWAIAASCVHYVNEVLGDMAGIDTDAYDFVGHAKHWSELKGFALGLQFNPRSQVVAQDFQALHDAIDIAPALRGDANVAAYRTGLLEARKILQDSYGFADANMGDESGQGGW
jgi:hypothetical protein